MKRVADAVPALPQPLAIVVTGRDFNLRSDLATRTLTSEPTPAPAAKLGGRLRAQYRYGQGHARWRPRSNYAILFNTQLAMARNPWAIISWPVKASHRSPACRVFSLIGCKAVLNDGKHHHMAPWLRKDPARLKLIVMTMVHSARSDFSIEIAQVA